MSNHTAGPWHVGIKQADVIVYDKTGWAIANATVFHGREDIHEMKANARLIAAAPDMLDALRVAEATIERLQRHAPGSAVGTLDVIRAAIAKAQ